VKFIKNIGLVIFIIGLTIFTASVFTSSFNLTQQELNSYISDKGYKSEIIKAELSKAIVTTNDINIFEFSSKVRAAFETSNNYYDAQITKYSAEKNWAKKSEQYAYKIFGKPHSLSYELAKKSGKGFIKENPGLVWFLTFGLGIIGALLFILPNLVLLGKPGIKNDGIYHESAGWYLFI
jgi:ferredoxin-type protein NapH